MGRLRAAFMGTPDFSAHVLDALIDAGYDIVCVYSQPPRRAGRGKKLTASAVQKRAEEAAIPVRTPVSLKSEEIQQEFADLELDVAIVVAYGLILPRAILDSPRFGCLNLHASLLPRWRGAAPIQRAIMAGDTETGVAVMQMATGLDTGDVLAETRVPITAQTTAGLLHDELAVAGSALLLETLPKLGSGELRAVPQTEAGVTYAEKIQKSEGAIDWTRSAEDLDRQIRGLSPIPGTYFIHGDSRIKLIEAKVCEDKGLPGQLLDNEGTVACGKGALKLVRLQRAGKTAMDLASFCQGHPLAKGDMLT